MKRAFAIICLILVSAMLATLALGCSQSQQQNQQQSNQPQSSQPSADNDAGAQETPEKKGTLVLQASTDWIYDTDRELAKGFEEQTGTKVDIQTFPGDQYETLIRVKINTNEAGDLIWIRSGAPMRDYFPEDNFVDMSDFAFASKMDDYAKNSVTIDGKVYAFPTITPGGWGIAYNKKIFEKYGLSVPKNYEELSAVCDVLLENGVTPIHEWGAGIWHFGKWFYGVTPAAYKEVPDLFDKLNNNTVKFADIKAYEVFLEQFKTMAEKGYFGDSYMSDTWEKAFEEFGSGKYAMALIDACMVPEIINLYPDQDPNDYAEFPVVLAGCQQFSANTGGPALMLSKNSKNMDAAVQYIDYLSEDAQLNYYYQNHPTRSVSVWNGITGRSSPTAESVIENSVGGVGYSLEGNMFYDNEVEIHKYIQDYLMGGRSANDVLVSIDEYREKLFAVNQ